MTKQGDRKPNLITKNRVSNTLLDMIVTVCCALNNLCNWDNTQYGNNTVTAHL